MDAAWRRALGRQFEASIDMLEDALCACPDELWGESLWEVKPHDAGISPVDRGGVSGDSRADDRSIQVFSAFWYLAYHTLFFLDLYLSGGLEQLEQGFHPPAPFTADEHAAGVLPRRLYTRAELQDYLAHGRQKCKATIAELSDEQASRTCRRSTGEISFAELLLVNMCHVQQHGHQLHMFLGQKVASASA